MIMMKMRGIREGREEEEGAGYGGQAGRRRRCRWWPEVWDAPGSFTN